ncbi:hypothetical protein GUITHDRAFT_119015 [Guillardia theta CCMP2712]|uniref:Uncharacterized protein n=1 Tax=Guillardia theta (strain CCMP2712) TaxID=905079 RepID=L1IFJ8_GUITC|nr:hypothetical protein GUITHDRAFT_119015 [Guillardia theta CCMP2712]EKX34832.1 hypothetical protein GUITHDRAFT_119015 [Guillardia theta CCMP2712]|eukprot:XP_005821812.1 hypothetical protein GUITHDRAFT_119015 [Guillardia theta CCMP2712]
MFQTYLKAHEHAEAIRQQLDTLQDERIELRSAIQSHKKALKKAKKEETKAARRAKIADLDKEYKKVGKKEIDMRRDYLDALKKLR